MSRTLIEAIFLWLMLALSVMYMLEMPWRLWRNRLPRWGPLYGEFLLAILLIWFAATNRDARAVRVLTALFFCIGTLHRLIVRKRLGIPAWPPV
jgi:hypothetical protein